MNLALAAFFLVLKLFLPLSVVSGAVESPEPPPCPAGAAAGARRGGAHTGVLGLVAEAIPVDVLFDHRRHAEPRRLLVTHEVEGRPNGGVLGEVDLSRLVAFVVYMGAASWQ